MRWWLAFALVGCYSPHAETGIACQPKAPFCPTGQMCLLRGDVYVCDVPGGTVPDDAPAPPIDSPRPVDAAIFDGTPADLDGDGIPNAQDNCPTIPNPDQANEDGDKFGDVCDPCPPVADDAPADSDNDGVADACDPRPNTPGDKIFLFEGFNHPLQGWSINGNWTVAGGAITVDGTGGHAGLSINGPLTGHLTVSAGATPNALGGNNDAAIGVLDVYDHGSSPKKGVYCHLTRWGSNTPLAVVPMHTAPENDAPFELNLGQPYVIRQRHDGNNYTCTAARGQATQTVTIQNGLSMNTPEIGLRVTNAKATFAWLMVIFNN